MPRMKYRGQIRGQELAEIASCFESPCLAEFDKLQVGHEMVAASTPSTSAMAWIASLFDFHKRHFNYQVLVRKYTREIDQLVK